MNRRRTNEGISCLEHLVLECIKQCTRLNAAYLEEKKLHIWTTIFNYFIDFGRSKNFWKN